MGDPEDTLAMPSSDEIDEDDKTRLVAALRGIEKLEARLSRRAGDGSDGSDAASEPRSRGRRGWVCGTGVRRSSGGGWCGRGGLPSVPGLQARRSPAPGPISAVTGNRRTDSERRIR